MKLRDFKNEIKVLDITALIARTKALKIELSDLVLDKNINKIKNLKSISAKKKDLARVLTTLTQKLMIASLEPKEMSEVPAKAIKAKEKSPVESSKKVEKTEKVKKGVEKK